VHEHPNTADEDLDDLLHYMVDTLLDGIFPMLEQVANRLDSLEEAALRAPTPRVIEKTYALRGTLRGIRQQLWPLKHQDAALPQTESATHRPQKLKWVP